MNIQFLGTGGAFQSGLGNSSALLTLNGQRYLVDCGHSVFPKLRLLQMVDAVDAVMITHLHDDHVGSLSSLVLFHKLALRKGRIKLICPSEAFGKELRAFLDHSLGESRDYIQFVPVEEVPGVLAVDTLGMHVPWMQTWAYCFTDGKSSVAYSGDLGDPRGLFERLDEWALPKLRVFHEVSLQDHGSAHTYYPRLHPYAERYEIFTYHCDHREKPADFGMEMVADHPELLL